MIATHNIKVNGQWVMAGEEYQPEVPVLDVPEEITEEPVKIQEPAPEEKPVKAAPKQTAKPATTPARRKKASV